MWIFLRKFLDENWIKALKICSCFLDVIGKFFIEKQRKRIDLGALWNSQDKKTFVIWSRQSRDSFLLIWKSLCINFSLINAKFVSFSRGYSLIQFLTLTLISLTKTWSSRRMKNSFLKNHHLKRIQKGPTLKHLFT